jgi:hypothetical protein
MPKVLLAGQNNESPLYQVKAVLESLGIDVDVMFTHSASGYTFPQPIAGVSGALDPTSTAMRNLLRQYSAVLVLASADATAGAKAQDPMLNLWLQSWNAPEDPPVFHFGAEITANRTSVALPSDFPIVRANTADVASTMWQWEQGIYAVVGGRRTRIGTRVKFVRENRSVYARAYNFRWSNECAAYLVEASKVGGGTSGELLVVPDFPDQNRLPLAPDLHAPAFGVRYRNHYFLPAVQGETSLNRRLTQLYDPGYHSHSFLWVLYALKLAGVSAPYRVPVVMDGDHYLASYFTTEGQARCVLATYEWMRDFGKARSGFRFHITEQGPSLTYSPSYQSDGHPMGLLYMMNSHPDAGLRAVARAIRDLLAQNLDVFSTGLHDHRANTLASDPSNAFGGRDPLYPSQTLPRHYDTSGRYRYAAPNKMPTGHGVVVNRKVAPSGYAPDNDTVWEFELGGERWLDINPPTTTAGTVNWSRANNLWLAKAIMERNAYHHDLLGLSYKSPGGYTNLAGNQHGNRGYWEAFLEFGFKGIRYVLSPVYHPNPFGDPRSLQYRGLQFVPTGGGDAGNVADGTIESQWHLVAGGETLPSRLSAGGDGSREVIILRRYLSYVMDVWLASALLLRGTLYVHPDNVAWNDPNRVVDAMFSGSWGSVVWSGVFNFVKELLLAMDEIIGLLPDYLKWSSVEELLAFRMRWM